MTIRNRATDTRSLSDVATTTVPADGQTLLWNDTAGEYQPGDVAASPHATTHEPGGTDAMTVDATAGTGSLRTLGTGAQQAAPGDHSHGGSASSFSRNFLTMGA